MRRRRLSRDAIKLERLVGLADLSAQPGEAGLGRLVVLVDVHRLGVGAGRLFLVAEALVGEAAAGPSLQALRIGADRLVKEAYRRAVEGLERKKLTKGGEPIIDPATGQQYVEREYSDALLMFLLKGALSKTYREHISAELSGQRQAITLSRVIPRFPATARRASNASRRRWDAAGRPVSSVRSGAPKVSSRSMSLR